MLKIFFCKIDKVESDGFGNYVNYFLFYNREIRGD